MLFLATHTSEENKMGVDDIARELDMPRPFLAKILQQLSRYNLATSTKGRNGGFYLTEEHKSATLLPVIECIDGPETLTGCILGFPECGGTNPCTFHDQAQQYREGMLRALGNKSIKETAQRIKDHNLNI